ncbi:MAG: recombinase family protein [Oscillospiraceae bacterium]|nr:recombinase family protein [Oscillospiraceae bacterium]
MEATRTVTMLPPDPKFLREQRAKPRKQRVAAYCRVSTDEEDQLNSYEAQLAYFTDKINSNPSWELAGLFADEGISGLSTKKRDGFNRLIALCKKGKVDMILVKSISRFARNTLDSISHVRILKALGVAVVFEKEGINTADMSSEMLLTVFSAFAQAESESISGNVKWGIRKSYKDGKVSFQYSRFYGYERGADGQPSIVPEQAEVVRWIYQYYLAGASIGEIKKQLESRNIPSSTGKQEWSLSVIRYLISNEKYCGDAILQKSYVVDCISKKTKKNNGEIPKYYVRDNHAAIIDRDLWDRAQEEIARRAGKKKVSQKRTKTENGKYSGKYALSELLVCGGCSTAYRRVTWTSHGVKRIVWRCLNRLEFGVKYCRDSPTIPEEKLHAAILRATNTMLENLDGVRDTLRESLTRAIAAPGDGFDRAAAEDAIKAKQEIMLDLVRASTKSETTAEYLDARFEELGGELRALQDAVAAHDGARVTAANADARLTEILALLDADALDLTEYDDSLTRRVVERITAQKDGAVKIIFKTGFETELGL